MLIYPTAIGSEPDHPDFDTQPLWERVIVANGIANGTFMVAVNRFGEEPPLTFYGSSFISDPYGRVLVQAPRDEAAVLVADLDLDQRGDWLELFPFLTTRRPDAYASLVRDQRGSGLMSSTPDVTATGTMTCPKCGAEMRTHERNGVTIEQCRKCHGIFLDAGEFEQLLGREMSPLGPRGRRRDRAGVATVAALIEFPADDTERALRFWRGLLDLDLAERGAGEGAGWVADAGGVRVGVHERGRGPGDTGSLPYFPVPDMTSALRKVEDLGGAIVHPGEHGDLPRLRGHPFALEQR